MPDEAAIRARLKAAGQEHVLRFADSLSDADTHALLRQAGSLDLESLPRLIGQYVARRPEVKVPTDLEPPHVYALDAGEAVRSGRPWDRDRARLAGDALLRAGRVAVFTVAGGQGTRLGYDGPKGCYPGGAVTEKPLFACLADWVLAARERFGCAMPWYIMTSPLNHEQTTSYFESRRWFGLPKSDVMFFQQGVMPSLSMGDGRLLLSGRSEIATNPDGHGGSLRALHSSGALRDMRERGVEHISYTQIDNPIVRAVDPIFLGLHAGAPDSSAEMSSKMVAKAGPGEKVGVFCRSGGRTMVIEYSDMPAELSGATNADGSLRFNAGSIAVHVISRAFVEGLNESAGGEGFRLPYHRADKKVPHIDVATGERVEPTTPNAVKLEAFVFDAIPLAERSIVVETSRVEEFAPIKNAEGVDSPATSREVQTERAARWLEAAGVAVPRDSAGRPDCVLEISARTAMFAEDLAGREGLPKAIERGQRLAL